MDDPRLLAAAQTLERFGADLAQSVVVRDGLSLLVRSGRTLVRVRESSGEPVALREVEVARALQEADVPAVKLLAGETQPWVNGKFIVTAWQWHEVVRPTTPRDSGLLAKTLRERTANSYGVPTFDPIGAARNAVAHIRIGDPQGDFVRLRARQLADSWAGVAYSDPAGTVMVHGDLHGDNVLVTSEGPILADLELAGVGPASYDTAPAAVAVKRYGADPSELEQFVEAQQFDPRSWDGFATCIDAYELWVTAWAVGVRERSGELRDEAEIRVSCLRDGLCEPWRLL